MSTEQAITIVSDARKSTGHGKETAGPALGAGYSVECNLCGSDFQRLYRMRTVSKMLCLF